MADMSLFDCLLEDNFMGASSDLLEETVNVSNSVGTEFAIKTEDLLEESVVKSGILEKSWDNDTDSLLDSILVESQMNQFVDLESGLDQELAGSTFSDTSSDSGCQWEQLSPVPDSDPLPVATPKRNRINVVKLIRKDTDNYEGALKVVNPMTNSPGPIKISTSVHGSPYNTGTTTIVLPVVSARQTVSQVQSTSLKRRRISASSNDSGVDDEAASPKASKYPPLLLSDEEKRLCEREGIRLPSHYPLSREEEKNLKRIRRKIRNKVSAQDSRKRKKEYVDAMEDRVKKCTEENEELSKKIDMLEAQNKTLAGQLRRLHQIIVNGGLKSQTSTAMMVLLLSTALFLIPGFKEQSESKHSLDIAQAIKMPPLPGQSRSLLQFAPLKQEFANKKIISATETEPEVKPQFDHDYFSSINPLMEPTKMSYIEDDAEPMGYGPAKLAGHAALGIGNGADAGVERRINVTRGPGNHGMRTVVLHVPKDIK